MTTPQAEGREDVAWLHRFINCVPFGADAPVSAILRARDIVDSLRSELAKAREEISQLREGSVVPVSWYEKESARAAAAEREVERAFAALELCGVPRERAKSVANGIQVFMTRTDRERISAEHEVEKYRRDAERYRWLRRRVRLRDERSLADIPARPALYIRVGFAFLDSKTFSIHSVEKEERDGHALDTAIDEQLSALSQSDRTLETLRQAMGTSSVMEGLNVIDGLRDALAAAERKAETQREMLVEARRVLARRHSIRWPGCAGCLIVARIDAALSQSDREATSPNRDGG